MSRLFKTDMASLVSEASDLVTRATESCYGLAYAHLMECLKMKLDSGLIDSRQFCELSLMLARYFVQEAEKH